MKTKVLFFLISVVIVACVRPIQAEGSIVGTINIDQDYVAHMDFVISCTPGSRVHFYNTIKNFGSTGVDVKYSGGSVAGNSTVSDFGGDNDVVVACGQNATTTQLFYTSESTVRGLARIYEIPVVFLPEHQHTRKHTLFISYPSSLTPVSSNRPYSTTSDGTLRFDIDFGNSQHARGESVLIAFVKSPLPSGASEFSLGGVRVYALERSLDKFRMLTRYDNVIHQLFRETLGVDYRNKKIVAFVTDVSRTSVNYEAGAVFVYPNIILFNDEDLKQMNEFTLLQIWVHELTHALTVNPPEYRLNVPWLEEGIAVFHQQYVIDKFLSHSQDEINRSQVLSSYRKFRFADLNKQYAYTFDFDFLGNNAQRPIGDSYSHAGLVVYKMFLDDPSIIMKLQNSLSNQKPNFECRSCDTDRAIFSLTSLTGKNRNQILYPFKDESSLPEKYRSLFDAEIDEEVAARIELNELTRGKRYFDESTPVEIANSPKEKVSADRGEVIQKSGMAAEDSTTRKQTVHNEDVGASSTTVQDQKERGGVRGWFFGLLRFLRII